ncbi:MAG TPA: DUF6600 domain-containing protein [Bryobacteraceae bacterium]|jgi:hypothetical protein
MKSKLIASALLCAAALLAQDPNQAPPFDPNQAPPSDSPVDPNQAPSQDPPSRVARLDLIQGQVSFQPATVSDWTAATLNYPMTVGDHLYADDSARAELHIGSTAVRLGPRSGLSVLNLDDHLAQIRVDTGAMILRVKYLDDGDAYEIDTAQGAITILRPGEYRIDTDPDRNATMVTVRSGDAAVSTQGGNFPVHPRQTAYFAGDGQPPQIQSENPTDPFDLFALDQDRAEDSLPEPRYVSRDMPGWQDLDRNGQWGNDPSYGPVWRPTTVEAGWAPYRYGHWAWIEPWGWTWIDDAPWGFAPFHYGRWVMAGGGWAWVPGPVAPRPVYAPALVAFVGGHGFSMAVGVGAGIGAVAWFPLGPREVFVPAYRVSPVYVNRVNVTTVNVTNIAVVNRTYVNRTYVTAVDQRTFVSAQPVHRAIMNVPPGAIARAEIAHSAAVAPQRASVLAHPGPAVNVPHPSAAIMQRSVVAQHAPAPAAVPFAARQQALHANPGRPVDPQTVNSLRRSTPAQAPSVRTLPPSSMPSRPAPQSGSGNPSGNPPGQFNRPSERERPQSQPAVRDERTAPHNENRQPQKKENNKKREEKKEK